MFWRTLAVSIAMLVLSAVSMAACGSDTPTGGFADPNSLLDGSDLFSSGDTSTPDVHSCTGLECQQESCTGSDPTTVTGTVYAPNGVLPVYNAIVYVPNRKPDPFPQGATCDQCGSAASGSPVVITLTDALGKFKLENVPVGKDIPLVIQMGKWRRQITIPEVARCTETKLTDKDQTRLPRKQSEGDMPHIAITRGQCDQLGCMLPKIGIDPSEFGTSADGRSQAVHVYINTPTSLKSLWSDATKLKEYDLAIFSCECTESPATKDAVSFQAVTEYLAAGGRIFTTDYQYTWYKNSSDTNLQSVSNITGGAPNGGKILYINDTFPKGKALADWLQGNFPTSTYGSVTTSIAFDNFKNPVDMMKGQVWATPDPGGVTGHARVLTINTPVGMPADKQCGKAVHIDAHVNTTDDFPRTCTTPLSQAESMFAFFFLDLSSCVQKDDKPPIPPVK